MSSLTDEDLVKLVASYNDLSEEKGKVSPAVLGRGYTPEALAQATKKISDKFNPVVSCGLRFTKPFSHLKFDSLVYVLTLFDAYQRGCLPFPGSVSEQPGQIMDIFSVLERLKFEAEEKARAAPKPKPQRRKR